MRIHFNNSYKIFQTASGYSDDANCCSDVVIEYEIPSGFETECEKQFDYSNEKVVGKIKFKFKIHCLTLWFYVEEYNSNNCYYFTY